MFGDFTRRPVSSPPIPEGLISAAQRWPPGCRPPAAPFGLQRVNIHGGHEGAGLPECLRAQMRVLARFQHCGIPNDAQNVARLFGQRIGGKRFLRIISHDRAPTTCRALADPVLLAESRPAHSLRLTPAMLARQFLNAPLERFSHAKTRGLASGRPQQIPPEKPGFRPRKS